MSQSQRAVGRVVTTAAAQPGFIGEGHTAVQVLDSDLLEASDPFVQLMDDRLDLAERRAIGGAHPHAGLETVTLILEGTLTDRDEGQLTAGDAIWMTAGRGIIHNEHVEAEGRSRILQLWVRLPTAQRAAAPRFEIIRGARLPVRRESGVVARLYSGATGALRSPTLNHAPVTLVDFDLQPVASVEQALPGSYQGFIYVLRGEVRAEGGVWLREGQVGWLAASTSEGDTELRLTARGEGARVVLYAGQPQREPLIHRGPFVATDEADMLQVYARYRRGEFTSMSQLKPV